MISLSMLVHTARKSGSAEGQMFMFAPEETEAVGSGTEKAK